MSGSDPHERGAAAWPGIEVGPAKLSLELERRGGGDDIDAAEIYIALACAGGDSSAIAAFEDRYFDAVVPALSRLRLSQEDIEEVKQVLRQRLFVGGDGQPPAILGYAGQGRLGGLVRVAAVRAGLTLLRGRRQTETEIDWLDDLPGAGDDPHLATLKAQHRVQFKEAFEDAIGDLSDRERSVLRMHFVDRLSIDDIAGVYAVHRATSARWLARARDRLAAGARRRLIERWNLRGPELTSVAALVESQLTMSLDRLLASAA